MYVLNLVDPATVPTGSPVPWYYYRIKLNLEITEVQLYRYLGTESVRVPVGTQVRTF
eukprot:SAG31_NODE_9649_length_1245_cov_22.221640_1_plen_57_part_00